MVSIQWIPVVLCFTPNYLIPAATTILSILESSSKSDRFEIICLLTQELSEVMQESLQDLDRERLQFVFLNFENELKDIYIDERYTAAASYRLLLPNFLLNHDRIVYLDSDIIVRNNIADLYRSTLLGDNYLAAVYEATLDFQIPYLTKVGCKPGEYINSGFLIMNLQRMRDDNIAQDLLNEANNPDSQFPDQDALNVICKGRILGLSPIYNSIRTYFLPQYKKDFLKYYTESDWNNVQNHGTIHYTGSKPWNGYTVEFVTWWNYYLRLPKSIRKQGKINKRVLLAAMVLKIPLITKGFNFIQRIYRKVK